MMTRRTAVLTLAIMLAGMVTAGGSTEVLAKLDLPESRRGRRRLRRRLRRECLRTTEPPVPLETPEGTISGDRCPQY